MAVFLYLTLPIANPVPRDQKPNMNTIIKVEFIDAEDGSTMGVSDVPIGQLPESFEVATTLNMNGEEWAIEEAIPAHSDDFKASGKLQLKMKKLGYINPKDILFSLPTIANELPATTEEKDTSDANYAMVGDEWRQFEFLPFTSLNEIETDLRHVRAVRENYNKPMSNGGTAYTKCHVRSIIGEPKLIINFEHLQKTLGSSQVGSLKFSNPNAMIKHGFSLKTEHSTFYGIMEDGLVMHLGITEFTEHSGKEIKTLVENLNLVFVDWINCQKLVPRG